MLGFGCVIGGVCRILYLHTSPVLTECGMDMAVWVTQFVCVFGFNNTTSTSCVCLS